MIVYPKIHRVLKQEENTTILKESMRKLITLDNLKVDETQLNDALNTSINLTIESIPEGLKFLNTESQLYDVNKYICMITRRDLNAMHYNNTKLEYEKHKTSDIKVEKKYYNAIDMSDQWLSAQAAQAAQTTENAVVISSTENL